MRYLRNIGKKLFGPSSKYPLPIIPGDVNTDMPPLLRECPPVDPGTCTIQLGSIPKTNRYRERRRTSTDKERVDDCYDIIGKIQQEASPREACKTQSVITEMPNLLPDELTMKRSSEVRCR
jgi:hypothetical protein